MQPGFSNSVAGQFRVHVVDGRTKNPHEWASEIVDFILAISDRASHDIRVQAFAYQVAIRAKIANAMFTAICEQKRVNAERAAMTGAPQVAHAIWHGPLLEFHPADFWAEAIAGGVINIGDDSDDLIRDQAHAFRDRLVNVALQNVLAARASERQWDSVVARKMGAEEAAEAILSV